MVDEVFYIFKDDVVLEEDFTDSVMSNMGYEVKDISWTATFEGKVYLDKFKLHSAGPTVIFSRSESTAIEALASLKVAAKEQGWEFSDKD